MLLDWITFLADDIHQAILAIELKNLAYPTYIALWLIILFFPLSGIDKQDPIAGLVYILYCLGSGVTLFFALPGNFTKNSDIKTHLMVCLSMGLCACYRWFRNTNRTLTREEHEAFLKKKEEEKNA